MFILAGFELTALNLHFAGVGVYTHATVARKRNPGTYLVAKISYFLFLKTNFFNMRLQKNQKKVNQS
jgi:hypothetical protein